MWIDCNKCGKLLPLYNFDISSDRPFSIRRMCKNCRRKYRQTQSKNYRKNLSTDQKEKVKKYRDEYNKNYYQNNKDKFKISYKKHIEKVYNDEHLLGKFREHAKNRTKKYKNNHPDVVYESNRRRKSLEVSAEGSHTYMEFIKLFVRYDRRCLCCGKQVKRPHELTADHITPLSKGGSDYINNIQPLCKQCNCIKGIKTTNFRKEWGERRWGTSKEVII
jgi:hypothetical protein